MSNQTMQDAGTQPAQAEATTAETTDPAVTPTPQQTQPATEPTNGNPAAAATAAEPGPVPYSRFKEVNDRLKAVQAEQEAAAAAAEEARIAQLTEQEKYKELYETAIAAQEKAEAERAALEIAQLKRDTAAAVGLPPALATRISGTTAEEIEADAKTMLEAIPAPAAPNLNAGAGRPQPARTAPDLDAVKEKAARLGVSWKNLAKEYGIELE